MPAFLIPLAMAAGSALAGMAKGSAQERTNQNTAAATQDRSRADIYGTQQSGLANLLALYEKGMMDRARLGIDAPSARAKQILTGSMMQNLKPFTITPPAGSRVRMPQISGGLSPAALSSMARAGGGELQRQGLSALLTGSDVPGMPDYSRGLLPAPQLSQMKQPGKFESIAGLLGTGLSAAGEFANAYGAAKPAPTMVNNRLPVQDTNMNPYGMARDWRLPQGQLQPQSNAQFNPNWNYGSRGQLFGG